MKVYRTGAVGAMMDEYERAALELRDRVASMTDETYGQVRDPDTQDENCRSIQTILSHVVSSGYGYADYLRVAFGIPSTRPDRRMLSRIEALAGIEAVLRYTEETLKDHWEMPEDQIVAIRIHSRWGQDYDLEQLMEHAIVHMLRHRRQIDKFLNS